MNKKIKKLIKLNLGITIINILVFSNFGLGFKFGVSIGQTILSTLVILLSVIIFIKWNKKILNTNSSEIQIPKFYYRIS